MKKMNFFDKISMSLKVRKNERAYKRKEKKAQKALKIIRELSKDSYLVNHFKKEVEYAWGTGEDEMQDYMVQDIVDILSLISLQGDSGFSIGYKTNLLNAAIDYKIIKPLSFLKSEFNYMKERDGIDEWQNKRLSSVFMKDNFIYDINALSHHVKGRYNISTGKFEKEDHGSWHGPLIMYKDGEFYHIGTKIINMDTYRGENYFCAPSLEVYDSDDKKNDFFLNVIDYDILPKRFFKDYEVYKDEANGRFNNEVLFCTENKDMILECLKKIAEEDD